MIEEIEAIEQEQVDDIPLLLAVIKQMGIIDIFNEQINQHGNREGMAAGHILGVWLAYILSQGDHIFFHLSPFLFLFAIVLGQNGANTNVWAQTAVWANHYIYLPVMFKPPLPPSGLWLTRSEIMLLPTSGPAWEQLLETANETAVAPDLSDQDEETNLIILAKALVYARTGQASYAGQVEAALHVITYNNTEDNLGPDGLPRGRTLSVGRKLVAYILAADLIDLAHRNGRLDADFRVKLRQLLTKQIDAAADSDETIQITHEQRPNNWGTHAGATRIAIALYLGNEAELARAAQVFQGWLGDRAAYASFNFGSDLSWQCNPAEPVPLNPLNCAKDGHNIGGALPDEMRRGGSFIWPPVDSQYPWEGLQGAVVQAQLLHRAGYPAWEWGNRALLRAVQFLYDIGWSAANDDEWQIWLVNWAYGSHFATELPASTGKNMGFTDWSHGS